MAKNPFKASGVDKTADPTGVFGLGQTKGDVEEVSKEFFKLNDILSTATSYIDRFTSGIIAAKGPGSELSSQAAMLSKELKTARSFSQDLQDEQDSLSKKLSKAANYEEKINKLKDAQVKAARIKKDLENNGLTMSTRQAKQYEKQKAEADKVLRVLVQKKKLAEQIEFGTKKYMKILGGAQKIPILGSLIDMERVQKKMQDTAAKTGSRTRTLAAGIGETFKTIGLNLLNPVTLLGSLYAVLMPIVKMVLEFEDYTFKIAHNLGITVAQAKTLRGQFMDIAAANSAAALSSKEVAETYGKINEQLGFLAPVNNEFLGTATKLEKRIGATAEQMSALATYGALSGKSLNQAYATAVGFAKVSGARNKLAMTERQILDAIAKTSYNVQTNFKGNLPALAEAIVRAKKLGTTLDQVAKQGDSLLDFESSIASEFEAQVISGKNLNLTRARELALAGDTAGLMEELNRQNLKFSDYSKMNVIAQESFAKALGLSREELSKQLIMQEQSNKLGAQQGQSLNDRYNQLIKEGKTREEIAGLIGNAAEAQLNQASRAEQLQKTIENLKEKLASMLQETVLPLVDKVIAWLQNSVNIKKVADILNAVFAKIGDIINNFPAYLEKAKVISLALARVAMARAAFSIAAATATMGPVGAVAAIPAGIAAYAAMESMLPKLEDGGLIKGSPEGTMVVAGENNKSELVVPLPKGMSAFDRPIHLTANLVVDGRVVATKNIKYGPEDPSGYLDNSTGIT